MTSCGLTGCYLFEPFPASLTAVKPAQFFVHLYHSINKYVLSVRLFVFQLAPCHSTADLIKLQPQSEGYDLNQPI